LSYNSQIVCATCKENLGTLGGLLKTKEDYDEQRNKLCWLNEERNRLVEVLNGDLRLAEFVKETAEHLVTQNKIFVCALNVALGTSDLGWDELLAKVRCLVDDPKE